METSDQLKHILPYSRGDGRRTELARYQIQSRVYFRYLLVGSGRIYLLPQGLTTRSVAVSAVVSSSALFLACREIREKGQRYNVQTMTKARCRLPSAEA